MSDETMTPLDGFVKRARNNYANLTATPQNMAHADQGTTMWRRAFEENGLPLDPITARVVIFALGLCGARAANQLPDDNGNMTTGEMVNWACAEASTYVVPALGEMPNLEDLILLDPDYDIEVKWVWDWAKLAKWGGFGLFAVTSAILSWRERG